ncbi:hypothetical protein SALBM311S_00422 [Streptomyces alboniger]
MNPPGSTAPRTRTYFDALGRVTSVRHFTQDASSATAGRTTTYEYDARGNRHKVTDPAGNVWSYTFDARGRVTSATDPDTGTTETRYDGADRPTWVKNARRQETFTEYDVLSRPRYVRQGSATATPVKEYKYDDAAGGIGQPSESVRHTDTGDYVNRVTGYDADSHVTGGETVIPANAMTTGLSGTYASSYTYTPTGKPNSVTLPAKGGLAQEKVVTRYDADGLPESTSGLAWYTADATYSPFGEVLRTVSGSQPYRVWTTNFVDPHSGTLQRTVTDREATDSHRITDGYYSYDTTGTITSNARRSTDASGSTWDTQCFTYDVMGELAHAWTSKIEPARNGTGCKAANGTTWGPRTTYAVSSGPVADAADAEADATAPDSSLSSTLAAAAPDAATVATGATAYRQSYTFDWLGNRAKMTEQDPADATKNVTSTYGYGKTVAANGTAPSYTAQPHTMTSTASSPTGKDSTYSYDASGNTQVRDLSDTTQNLVWTPENKLDSITDDGKKTTYVYDADGNRLLENSPSGSTLYLGDTELTTNTTGTITQASHGYAYSNNSPISHSDPTGLWLDDGTGHSEPRSKGTSGGRNTNAGVPRGGTGSGGCYYSCTTNWVASQTPVTNDADRLMSHFSEGSPNGHNPDGNYWNVPIYENSGPSNACFGRLACAKAYRFLIKTGDSAGAKYIAGTYCLENYSECEDDARAYERGKLIESFVAALITGGRGPKGAKGLASACKCFLAGTDVLMADGSTKDIEDVSVGDSVRATDPETGETGPRKVTRLIRTDGDKDFNELSIATEDGIEELTATHEHPFWSPSEQDWITAGALRPGMTLLTDDGGTVIVTGNRSFTKHTRTYNLTVDDLHTYYVLAGQTPVLVHNSNCPLTGGFKVGVSPDEIADINRGFGGETLLSGSPANTLANASRYNSFWDKSAVVIRDIAGSHMFNNGNKRTAQATVEQLMQRNGVTSGPTSADLRSVIDRVGKGQLHDVSDISAALRGY